MTIRSFIYDFARAIRYPQEVPAGVRSFVFLVDGLEVEAEELSRGLVLRFGLECSEAQWVELAGYASGRLLREEAVLAWDMERERLFLWQELGAGLGEDELRGGFEAFVDSCEWWLSRCAEREVPRTVLPQLLIRP